MQKKKKKMGGAKLRRPESTGKKVQSSGRSKPDGYSASKLELRRLGPQRVSARVEVVTPLYYAWTWTLWEKSRADTKTMWHPRGDIGLTGHVRNINEDPIAMELLHQASVATEAAVMDAPIVQNELRSLGLLPPLKRCGCRCTCPERQSRNLHHA